MHTPIPLPGLAPLALAAALPALLLTLGCCCGGGGASQTCLGKIEVDGKTYQPELGVDDEDQALHNACNTYCLEADPDCEAMYGIWVTSPAGIAAGSPSKKDAMYQDDALLDCITATCADQCVRDVQAGTLTGSVTCS